GLLRRWKCAARNDPVSRAFWRCPFDSRFYHPWDHEELVPGLGGLPEELLSREARAGGVGAEDVLLRHRVRHGGHALRLQALEDLELLEDDVQVLREPRLLRLRQPQPGKKGNVLDLIQTKSGHQD